ncbi:MAG: hypothetical protein IJ110_01485 [Lachnospiraceae bacterium]|nr:hypothetical protein [Lachnospiraceae bacterium]
MIKVVQNKDGSRRCQIAGSTGELLDDLTALFHGFVEGMKDPRKKPVIMNIFVAAMEESGLSELVDEEEEDDEEDGIEIDLPPDTVDQLSNLIDEALKDIKTSGGEE